VANNPGAPLAWDSRSGHDNVECSRFCAGGWNDKEAARLAAKAREHFSATLGRTHGQTFEVSSRLGLYLWRPVATSRQGPQPAHACVATSASPDENEEVFALQRNIMIDLRARDDDAAYT
jgi:hypothetical protein